MENLRFSNKVILIHTVQYGVVKYNHALYRIIQYSDIAMYNDSDYYIKFDDKGIVSEAVLAE